MTTGTGIYAGKSPRYRVGRPFARGRRGGQGLPVPWTTIGGHRTPSRPARSSARRRRIPVTWSFRARYARPQWPCRADGVSAAETKSGRPQGSEDRDDGRKQYGRTERAREPVARGGGGAVSAGAPPRYLPCRTGTSLGSRSTAYTRSAAQSIGLVPSGTFYRP